MKAFRVATAIAGSRWTFVCAFIVMAVVLIPVSRTQGQAQSAPARAGVDVIHDMNAAFESLVKRASPAVVEVMVTGYGSTDDEEDEDSKSPSPFGRERSLGSGVIIDPDGYIITNYHVVKGADRVRVVLTPKLEEQGQAPAMLKSKGQILNAKIVGASKQVDLAVLKVEATGLPTLPFARYDRLHKGEVVLAFGSPEGLENSVTFGLVSSVLRQPDPDDPMVYIQTDAAINPGNSGGPLVDVDGNVVGIDTFIYTKSGGNEGIGFAIPSGIARYAYEQIRKYGRVRRRTIGADLQSLTPDLAGGLGITDTPGVVVADVDEGGSAAQAGLRVDDVIEAIDGMPVDNVALFTLSLYLRTSADKVNLQVVRGGKKLNVQVPVLEPVHDLSRLADLSDPSKDLIPRLGIVGASVNGEVADLIGPLRIPGGVLVTALVANRLAVDSGLQEGDVIHAFNRTPIRNMNDLRGAFEKLKPGDPAAVQVERNGKLTFLTFEME
ncbi:MAG TPA: trypsin-like peptidase domain-containing protein [Verrucomicrobiae bacterium]|nr:trypsin-like peptidase domain-containing protein [Verrucomicrobiae bacterium]